MTSSYDANWHPKLIRWIARWGLTDVQIAGELEIPLTMLGDWKQAYPEVAAAIVDGRTYWLELAENSLQKLVQGYDYDETIIELDSTGSGDQAKPTKVKKFTRHIPPNAQAIIFLMRNRPAFKLAKQIERGLPDGFPPALPR